MSDRVDENREERRRKNRKVLNSFNIVMGIFYIAVAILIFNNSIFNLSQILRYALTALVAVYGVFRTYRGLRNLN